MKKSIAIVSHPACMGVTLSAIHADCHQPCHQPEVLQCADNPRIINVFVRRPEVESTQMFYPPNPRPWERNKKGQKR